MVGRAQWLYNRSIQPFPVEGELEPKAMRRLSLISIMLIAAFILSHGTPAAAQGYRPAKPTLSPWLNLYEKRGGPLDPYHQFVRPELQLQDTLRQQNLTNQRQSAEVSALGRQVTQMEEDRLAPIRPTGSASVFMSYSHYYYAQGAAGRAPQTAPQAKRAWSPKPAGSRQSMGSVGRGF